MRNITTRLALFALLVPVAAAAGPKINPATQVDWTKVSGSGSPAGTCNSTFYGMPYTDTATGNFYVCAVSGWVPVSGGGGGGIGGSGTTNQIPKFTASTTLGNSTASDNGTTFTIGEQTQVNDGTGAAGAVAIKQGTAASNQTTSVTVTAPTSVTSYRVQLPGAAPTSGNTYLSCTAADPAVCSWAAGGGGGGSGPYPTGSTYVAMGNSFLLVNGYYVIFPTTYSCSSGVCTLQTPGTNNFVAGETITFPTGTPACLAGASATVDATSLTSQQFRVSGTTCGTTSGTVGGGFYITQNTNGTVSCTSNVCTVPAGNGFVAGHDVMFNPDFSPSCLRGRAFKVLSSGLSSSQFEVDTTGLTACGTTTGAGGVIWSGDTSAIETAVLGSSTTFTGFAPFASNFYNLALSDDSGNLGSNNGVLSSIVSNYTSYYHPFIANLVTAAAGKPVVIGIYTNEANGTSYSTDIANFLTLAADLHAEGSNVYVWLHTIPPTIGSDPNTISNPNVAASWAQENAWMSTQIGPSHASAAGKYFDRVVSLEASFTGGMQLDSSHLNNSGTYQFASIENTEAAAQGGSMKQQSPSLAALANYSTAFNYQCDSGSPTTCSMWRWNHNTGRFILTFGDPLVAGNATDVIEATSAPTLRFNAVPILTTLTGSTQCLYVDSAGQMHGTGSACASASAAFSALTGGTNTIAAMLVGSGASLGPTGTGTIQATNIANTIVAGSGAAISGAGTVASPYSISVTGSGPSSSVAISVSNASSTGTTLNTLTKLTGAPSTAVIAATSDTGGVIGITTAGAGTTGSATIQTSGLASCVFPGATTAGDYVQISSGTAGNCADSGATYPTSGQVIGRVLSTNASGGTYQIDIFPAEIKAASGGSGSGNGWTFFNSIAACTSQWTFLAGPGGTGGCNDSTKANTANARGGIWLNIGNTSNGNEEVNFGTTGVISMKTTTPTASFAWEAVDDSAPVTFTNLDYVGLSGGWSAGAPNPTNFLGFACEGTTGPGIHWLALGTASSSTVTNVDSGVTCTSPHTLNLAIVSGTITWYVDGTSVATGSYSSYSSIINQWTSGGAVFTPGGAGNSHTLYINYFAMKNYSLGTTLN